MYALCSGFGFKVEGGFLLGVEALRNSKLLDLHT